MTPLLVTRPRSVDRAFERLYQKHVHAVYRYALAVLHNQADAEDVTQMTFLSAYRVFARGERPERPHNWLIKIAHNVCRQRFRESARRPQEVAYVAEDALAAPPPDEEIPTADEIRRALGFLGFNQRAALVMRELEGRTYAEIASVLDLSVSAVETLIFRARRALREQLEGGLTCEQTEITLAQLAEGNLSKTERGALRAHLRECKDCAALERRRRAQRAALKNLAAAPLPASLGSFFGSSAVGGGVAIGGVGVGAKAAAVLAAGLVSAGLGQEAIQAVAAREEPAAVVRGPLEPGANFSPVSVLTGGRATANPIAARLLLKGEAHYASPGLERISGRRAHSRFAAGAPDEETAGAPTTAGASAGSASTGRPSIHPAAEPVVQTLPVTVPSHPRVPLPPPPPPPVTVPVQVPTVPPVPPVPPVPLPPPPPPPRLP